MFFLRALRILVNANVGLSSVRDRIYARGKIFKGKCM